MTETTGEMTEMMGKWWRKWRKWCGKWRKRRGKWRKRWGKPPKNDQFLNACNFLNNGPIFNPKKVLESSWSFLSNGSRNNREMTETMGGNDRNDEGKRQKRRGNHRLVCGLKLDWKCCPPWCRGFHPMVSWEMTGKWRKWREEMMETTGKRRKWRGNHGLVCGLKLDWNAVLHGVVVSTPWCCGKQQGNDGNDGRKRRGNDGNDGGHLKMTNLWMPVTSLIMVRFSIRKKFWKALDLLYQMAVETTGKRRKWWEETTGGNDKGETTETTDWFVA